MKRTLAAFGLVIGLALPSAAFADDPVISFEKYTLDNGLEVILHQDKSIPLVSVNVWYHVGSGDEVPGKSGFAHLFEHMLFQGSQHVGEDKHFDTLKNIGASGVNGTTNPDRTNYFEVVPSNQLETGLWLESDRMGYLLPLLNKTSLDNQIEVVKNERRQRYDNVAYGKARFATSAALYPKNHPYRYLTIGLHEDLENATLKDVKDFYRKWYAPSNATLVLAGDFDKPEAKRLVAKWFGTFPKTTKPTYNPPAFPEPQASRTIVNDEFAKLRRIDYVWTTPGIYKKGDAEFDILSNVLGRSGTGRLYKALVHDKQLAQRVAVYQASSNYSSTFTVSVVAKSGAKLEEIEAIMQQEIDKVMNSLVTQKEVDRAVVGFESGFIWGLQSLNARADRLQGYNHFLGKPNAITMDLDRYRNAKLADLQAMAKQYLTPERRVEILTMPAAKAAPTK
ncbi:MAG: insulinase family protein [Kofleriaceae bacterium]|nr:insulinase family protein [Kofleriaceae bacterium]